MEKVRDFKIVSLLILAAASGALAMYAWVTKFSSMKAPGLAVASTQSGQDDVCVAGDSIQGKENKNSHLFVSCGGFLE